MDHENQLLNQAEAALEEMQVDMIPAVAGNVPSTYEFHGIQVRFPHKAYQSQLDMMDRILSEVIAGHNLITESVAGTGKTLAILGPLLAWQENQAIRVENMAELDHSPPLIFYATKTLAHIKHIIGQLRLTEYSNTPMGILTSVRRTCNNEDGDEHLCEYNRDELEWSNHINSQPIKTWDLEDLKGFCRDRKTCAYFEMMNAKKEAKIVFCTYNYLLHPGIREALDISLEGNILVFDEGHNVEDLCREIASTPANFLTLAKVTAMSEILQGRLAPLKELPINANLATTFQRLRDYLNRQLGVVVNSNRPEQRVSFDDLLSELTAVGLGPDRLEQLKADISGLKTISSATLLRSQQLLFRTKDKIIRYLSNALIALQFLWEGYPTGFLNSNFYKILLRRPVLPQNPEDEEEDIPEDNLKHSEEDIELKLICVNPAVGFKCTRDARSVIVASATLSPIASTALELGLEFTSQLLANTVTPPERVFAAIVDRHADSRNYLKLTSGPWRKCRDDYQDQVARIIQDICRLVPHGVVVFFPTKKRIEELMSIWGENENGHLAIIQNLKQVFIEPREEGQDGLNDMLQQYKRHAETERGAILFSVMRGKLSEGIEFRDKQSRALVTIGIPFAPVKDTSLKVKREYQDDMARSNDILDGWDWYRNNAFKALNQAIGRNVRHAQDWGSIFLVDSRFSYQQMGYQAHLPQWVMNSLARDGRGNGSRSMEDIVPDLNSFVTRLA